MVLEEILSETKTKGPPRSLITGRGELQNGRGASQVLPLQKGGAEKSFNHAVEEGGGGKGFGVVLTQVLEVLAMLDGGAKRTFPLFNREGTKSFTLS